MAYLWAFIIGFMVALFPVIVLLRIFKGGNIYLRGAFIGFLVWIGVWVIMQLDLMYGFIGFMQKDYGGTLILLYEKSHFGFITCGLAVAFMMQTLEAHRRKSGGSPPK